MCQQATDLPGSEEGQGQGGLVKSASNQAPEATHEDRDSEHRHSHAATPHVLTRRKDTVRGCGHSRPQAQSACCTVLRCQLPGV